MQHLGQCREIFHLSDCQAYHNQRLSRLFEKAIWLYQNPILDWNGTNEAAHPVALPRTV
ncbi:protein of unknown function [Aminobacter niigataensis]|nr:protein of unknown function [Aminobacter niigataensis]